MATKKKVYKKNASKKTASKKRRGRADRAERKLGVAVRMYRLGVGDCFLLRFDRGALRPFSMLIDCGIHMAQAGGTELIREVVADIRETTGGRLDVIVGTHEHWDHISGFQQARDLFLDGFEVGEVWVGWTENSDDALAKTLKKTRAKAIKAVGVAAKSLYARVPDAETHPLAALQGFYGETTGVKLAAAGRVLWELGGKGERVRYREPGEAPIEIPDAAARVFVLGPPRDKALLKLSDPKKDNDEVYLRKYLDEVEEGLEPAPASPFPREQALPLQATRGAPFFERHYWSDRTPEAMAEASDDSDSRLEMTQGWRRIGNAWAEVATSLALKLDKDTNNTSLVLAIELGPPDQDGPVLLFAADAQVGNWLSWKDVVWTDVGGRNVTGPDLLRRTKVYKVGHHASHNATLQKEGLELMDALELALVPTDAKMAKKVKWGTLPWPKLLKRLGEKTTGAVLRTDEKPEGKAAEWCGTETDLYYEVVV